VRSGSLAASGSAGAVTRARPLGAALTRRLAAHGDLPAPQVDVAALRVVRVVAEPGQLGEPDTSRLV